MLNSSKMGSLFSKPAIRVELWSDSSTTEKLATLERSLNSELLNSQRNGSRAGDRVDFEICLHSGSPPGDRKKSESNEDEDENDNVEGLLFAQ